MEATVEMQGPRRWAGIRRMIAFAAVVLFVGLLIWGLLSKATNTRIDEELVNGRAPAAPAFELPVLEPGQVPAALARRLKAPLADGKLSLGELRNTPVVLNFWASWCGPCHTEAPTLRQGWRQLEKSGVLLLGLDMQDLSGDAREFLGDFGIHYPTVRDPGNAVAQDYGVTGVPETYFIDARGRVVDHVIGAVDSSQLATGAKAALAGRVVGTATGGAHFPQR